MECFGGFGDVYPMVRYPYLKSLATRFCAFSSSLVANPWPARRNMFFQLGCSRGAVEKNLIVTTVVSHTA